MLFQDEILTCIDDADRSFRLYVIICHVLFILFIHNMFNGGNMPHAIVFSDQQCQYFIFKAPVMSIFISPFATGLNFFEWYVKLGLRMTIGPIHLCWSCYNTYLVLQEENNIVDHLLQQKQKYSRRPSVSMFCI